MSCILGRRLKHKDSEESLSKDEFPVENFQFGESSLTWKRTVDGMEREVEVPLTDVLSFEISNAEASDKDGDSTLSIKYIKSQNDNQLGCAGATLQGTKQQISSHHENLKIKMETVLSSRPRKLLVFKNPFSGRGKALNIFTQIRPIFDEVGITCEEIVTTKEKDAEERIQKIDLSKFDGVVVVGGDGLLSEVINGLARYSQNKAGIDFNDHTIQQSHLCLPIGIIPAGTGNVYARLMHGNRDTVTAALHIVRGFQKRNNLHSIHQNNKLSTYSVLVFGFGFPGDIIKSSKSKNYLGNAKYFVASVDSLIWKHDVYSLRLSFSHLPSTEQQETVEDSEKIPKQIEGEFHAVEGFALNFNKNDDSLLPVFGEKRGHFVLIQKCSRFQHLSFYELLQKQKPNAYDLSYINRVEAELCQIELLEDDILQRRKVFFNYDGELLEVTSNTINIRLHHQIVSFFAS